MKTDSVELCGQNQNAHYVKHCLRESAKMLRYTHIACLLNYEGWNFNSGNYLFTTDTK